MSTYKIQEDLYLYPTPAGAYYAVSSPTKDKARSVLMGVLAQQSTPKINIDRIRSWANIDDRDDVAKLLQHMQTIGWLQGCGDQTKAPEGQLEDILPELLEPLSGDNKVLLADNHGFHISHTGLKYETLEQLSALSADISILHERHAGLLQNNLGLHSSAWAVVDAAGNSQAGFWPMYIGSHRFVLVIIGLPHLNQPTMTNLVWALNIRYGS